MAEIRIGTSGYSFKDWIGPFYPERTPSAKMLELYAREFDTVEVNFTYYRMPSERTIEGMVKHTPSEFRFIVKAHKSFTHEQDLAGKDEFIAGIAPMEKAGKLSGLLFQFPQTFKNTEANRGFLSAIAEGFRKNIAVEFRDRSWANPAVYQFLESAGIALVSVDEPLISTLFPNIGIATSDMGYVRFHSRDGSKWYKSGAERYDYLYSDEELREWLPKLRAIAQRARNIYIYFNNCHAAQAVKNARRMKELIKFF